jgi:hypothetical protein
VSQRTGFGFAPREALRLLERGAFSIRASSELAPFPGAFNHTAFIRGEVLDELGHRRLSAFQSVLDVSTAWGAFDGDPDPFRPMSAIHDLCFKTGTPLSWCTPNRISPRGTGAVDFTSTSTLRRAGRAFPSLLGSRTSHRAYL